MYRVTANECTCLEPHFQFPRKLDVSVKRLNSHTHLGAAAQATHGQGSCVHPSGRNIVESHHSVLLQGHNFHLDKSTDRGDTLTNGTIHASPTQKRCFDCLNKYKHNYHATQVSSTISSMPVHVFVCVGVIEDKCVCTNMHI